MTRSAAAPDSGFGNLPAEPAGLRAAAPAAGLRDGAAPGLASLRFRVEARADVNAAAPLAGCAEPGAEFGQQDAPVTAVPHSEADLNAAAAAFVGMKLAEIERVVIEATIQAHGDSLPRAARVLGISPSTLYSKRARWADLSGAG